LTIEGSSVGFLRRGATVVKDVLMREVRNGRRFPEIVWIREEGIGSSGQVVGWPDVTGNRISPVERGEKEVKV
jgi:hypothetical protein